MTLTLDHIQRLNLHALLGAQRGDVATIRVLWAIQDRLSLTSEEETAIGLKRECVSGRDQVVCDPAAAIPTKSITFSDTEMARIRAALDTWDSYAAASDRRWLEPLLCAILQP